MALALLVGLVVFVVVTFGFTAALAPHYATTRHGWKLGAIAGVIVTLVVAVVTFIPVQLLTRTARRTSFEDARSLIDDIAYALESAIAPKAQPD